MTLSTIANVQSGAALSPAEMRQYKVICAALWGMYHEPEIFYSNTRGKSLTDQFKAPPFVPSELDCSGFVTYCYVVAGSPNPNGGGGNVSTASLWNNGNLIGGTTVKVGALHPGDLVFYSHALSGPMVGGNGEHVSIYIDSGFVVSMGSNQGPMLLEYDKSDKPLYGVRRYPF